MKSIMRVFSGLSFCLLLGFGPASQAMILDWTGGYRFEYTEIERPNLGDPWGRKSYGLNYLYLMPQIVASDGVTINSRFDILGNQSSSYKGSQLGQLWGGTVTDSTDTSSNNTVRESQGATSISASQLYMRLSQEFGTLVVGRMPYEFGLGITHNAGRGAFDHWIDTHDMVGFKFLVGNTFFMPMIGRVVDLDPAQGGTNTEQMLQIQYESADSGSLLGILFERRNAGLGATQAGAGWLGGWKSYYNDSTASLQSDFSFQRTSFVLGRVWSSFSFKLEGGFAQGQTGISYSYLDSGTNTVVQVPNLGMNGYGLAAEMYYHPAEAKWDLNFRVGMASGDDPSTKDIYEGYSFDRNYDLAFLLFNHRLGQRDFLGTTPYKNPGLDASNSYDDESIANTGYLSPRVKYAWNDKMDVVNTLTYALLLSNSQNATDANKDLGVEWDLELVYKPRKHIQWVNQFGYLFAGSAFKNGSSNLSNENTMGFASKVSVSF